MAKKKKSEEVGLLPYEYGWCANCPLRGGPRNPHPDHPGKVGPTLVNGYGVCTEVKENGTIKQCQYYGGLQFVNIVCKHPKAPEESRKAYDAIVSGECERVSGFGN